MGFYDQIMVGIRWFLPPLVSGALLSGALVAVVSVPAQASTPSPAFGWGRDGNGQLGNASTTDTGSPVAVLPGANPAGTWATIGAGGEFSCGIAPDASAYCWGANGTGELGNGTHVDDSVPRMVSDGDNASGAWSWIDGGWNFTCGLSPQGGAYCWGSGGDGKLGNGSTSDDSFPSAVWTGAKPVGVPWSALAVGYGTVCGLAGGAAYCWGYNVDGQVGNGTRTFGPVSQPQAVSSNRTWRSISVGTGHACGVDSAGAGFCWGSNGSGELGNGTTGTVDDSIPRPVTFAGTWRSIEAGESSSCGLASSGLVYCWGANNYGQLGNGSIGTTDDSLPAPVASLSGVTRVSLGQDHACATTTSDVYCWGSNLNGQVGNGSIGGNVLSPVQVSSGLFTGLVPQGLAAGSYHSMVLFGVPAPDPPPAPTPASAPRDAIASAGDRSASVSWTAPPSSGSYSITNYLVTSAPGGRTCLTSALSCEVAGLANGTSYTFTVQALTGAGWSEPSVPSNAVTPSKVPQASILITGTRTKRMATVSGTTVGFGMGGMLTPWIRLAQTQEFQPGKISVLVSADGTFAWKRRVPAGAGLEVYFTGGDATSNTLLLPAPE